MSVNLMPPDRPRSTLPEPPPRPGLSTEAVAGLDPAAISARVLAAEARETESDRRYAAARLAQRVAAATPPPSMAPESTTASSVRESAPETPPRKPWRDAPLVVSTRPADPVREFTPDDLAALGRLLNHERKRDAGR